MLSSTVIQRYGMQLESKLGEKGKELPEQEILNIPATTSTVINKKLGRGRR